jgi:hypothetical protein
MSTGTATTATYHSDRPEGSWRSWSRQPPRWPRRSAPGRRPPPPPSANGSSRDRQGPLRQPVGPGTASCNRFRSSPRSGSTIGSGRQDGQGDAKAAHRIGHPGVPGRG